MSLKKKSRRGQHTTLLQAFQLENMGSPNRTSSTHGQNTCVLPLFKWINISVLWSWWGLCPFSPLSLHSFLPRERRMRSDVLDSPRHTALKRTATLIIPAFEPSAIVSVTNSLYSVTEIVKAESLWVCLCFSSPSLAGLFLGFFSAENCTGQRNIPWYVVCTVPYAIGISGCWIKY